MNGAAKLQARLQHSVPKKFGEGFEVRNSGLPAGNVWDLKVVALYSVVQACGFMASHFRLSGLQAPRFRGFPGFSEFIGLHSSLFSKARILPKDDSVARTTCIIAAGSDNESDSGPKPG